MPSHPPGRTLSGAHTHTNTHPSNKEEKGRNDENETMIRIYESVGTHTHTHTVVTHLDFHSRKLRLITSAYARPGAVNMLRPPAHSGGGWRRRHAERHSHRVQCDQHYASFVTCRKKHLHQHKLCSRALIVKFNHVFVLRHNMRTLTCAHTRKGCCAIFFSRSCRLACHFMNLNGDCLTTHFHFLLPVVLCPPPTRILSVLGLFIGSLQHCLPGFPRILNRWRPLMESSAFLRRPEKPNLLDALVSFLRCAVRFSTLRFGCNLFPTSLALKKHG